MVRRVNSSRAVATGSGGFRFRAFAGTLVVLCVLACAALILRFSASTSVQGPDDNAREDPTAGAGKRTSTRFRPGGAGAAVRRGGRRNAEQGGGARAGPQVAEETGKLSQELAAEKSTGPGGAASGARGGDGWDVEEVPVTRRRIPIPDDADLMTSAAAPGNGSEPVEDAPSGDPESEPDSTPVADAPPGAAADADAGGGDNSETAMHAGDGGPAAVEMDDADSGDDGDDGGDGGAEPVDVHEVDFHEEDPAETVAAEEHPVVWAGSADGAGADEAAHDVGEHDTPADDTERSSDDDPLRVDRLDTDSRQNDAEPGMTVDRDADADEDDDDDDDDDEGDDGDEGAEAGDHDGAEGGSEGPEGAADALDEQPRRIAFESPAEPGALGYVDMDWCPGAVEPPAADVAAVDERLRMLVVTGAREGGTDLLQAVLSSHPAAVVGTPHNTHLLVTAADDPGAAELNFHNAWPAADRQALLDMWPPEAAAEVAAGAGPARFLLDVSPEYLMNPVVPPRLKQLVPQAKVVVVLQDPTEAAYYLWSTHADRGAWCGEVEPEAPCVLSTFVGALHQHIYHFDRRSCDFSKSAVEGALPVTWARCNRCSFSFFDHAACMHLPDLHQDLFPCVRRQFSVFDACVWGAQLSWWLNFYTPEQLLVTSTTALTAPETRMEVFQSILEFAGVPADEPVDEDAVAAAVAAVNASSAAILASIEPEDVVYADAYFAPQMADLQHVLHTYFPDADLPGVLR